MIEFLLLGVFTGVILGLLPGFHINNIIPFFSAIPFASENLLVFLVSSSVAFTFSSFFPSILLGAPNDDTALSVLPGHRLVLNGKGRTALFASFYGGILSLFFSTVMLLFFATIMPQIYDFLRIAIPFLLIFIMSVLVLTDNLLPAMLVVIISGLLGYLTFNENLLLPLLTGFFGLSTLIISYNSNAKVPKQYETHKSFLSRYQALRISLLSAFLGSIFNIIPAISSSITAFVGKFFGNFKAEEYLLFMGGTNVTYMVFSFYAFMLLGNVRSGSAALFSQIYSTQSLLFVVGIALLSGILAAMTCLQITGRIIELYYKFDYRKVSLFAMVFLISVVGLFTGFRGLTVLFASTSIGLLANFLKVRRSNCMAALIVPTILVLL